MHGSLASRTSLPRASCSSTRARRSSPTSARRSCPRGYVRRLRRYRYGPGVFKLDWALDGPIPWRDPALPRGLDRPPRRHARGDRRGRGRRVARRASRSGPSCSSCSRASSIPAARRPASTRAMPTATCPRDRTSIAPTRSSGRSSASLPASATASSRATRSRPRISSATIPTTSAARSPAASPISSSSSRDPWRGSIRTPRRIRACSSARRRRRRAAACTGCAATSPRGVRGAAWMRLPTTLPELGAAP